MPSFSRAPVASVEMLIRRPAKDVFAAFVEPQLLTKFWLNRSSGPLVAGGKVHWEFMVKGAESDLVVKALEPNSRILIAWPDKSTVEWTFTERAPNETVVAISNAGFGADPDEAVATAIDSTQGFTIVLCELKALLEHGSTMNLVKDKALLLESQRRE
jgi:uncharacterized protein YndB with AHSA1/START domain